MSSVIIRFASQHLDFTNLSRDDAEAIAGMLNESAPGVTDIGVGSARYIVNRANIDYVEVRV